MSKQPLNPEQVLTDIKAEIANPSPTEPPLARSITHARRMQQQFRTTPVIGGLASVKKLVYLFTHSTFSQQYDLNETLLDLIDSLYNEICQLRFRQNEKIAELEYQLSQIQKLGKIPGESGRSSATDNSHPPINRLPGLVAIETAPAEMLLPERLILYSLIYGLKPQLCLEIGTFRGGSALIICRAMDDASDGRLVCVDPDPKISDTVWAQIQHRSSLVEGPSPDILPEAAKVAGQPFDFALIDGDHSFAAVLQDIENTLPLLGNQAHLILHDSHYFEVKDAIDAALQKHPNQLLDCGELSVTEQLQPDALNEADGRPVIWGGLRLLRFTRFSE